MWRLAKRQRQVLALRILSDLTEGETAQILGISPKTVSVHLHRALENLRGEIGRANKEGDRWTTQSFPVK